jgi:hypothetical protein
VYDSRRYEVPLLAWLLQNVRLSGCPADYIAKFIGESDPLNDYSIPSGAAGMHVGEAWDNLYRPGVPDMVILRILRHANVSTTTGY